MILAGRGEVCVIYWSRVWRVVSVSVEDLAEGERDRSTRLFEVEERSKVPEKEVTKREREINLEDKIGLVAQNRQTLFGITHISTLHPLPAFVGLFKLNYDLVITLPFGFGRYTYSIYPIEVENSQDVDLINIYMSTRFGDKTDSGDCVAAIPAARTEIKRTC
jgi:hypothetical protein